MLSLDLSKDLSCLEDLLLELVEIVEVALDLFKREIDEHTGDLGCHLVSDELFNVLVDELSNELLDVGVVDNDTWKHGESLKVISVDLGILMGQVLGSLDLEGSSLGCNLRNGGHLNKVGLLRGLLREAISVVVVGSGATSAHGTTLSGEALSTLGSTTLTTVVEASTGEAVVWHHGLLEELEDLMDQLEGIWAVKETGLKGEGVVLLLGEEVSLVLVLDLLLSADLWELVVGHVEGLSVEVLVVESDSSLSCRVWLLVADECSDSLGSAVLAVLILSLNDFDALNLSALSEKLKQLLLVVGGGEVLDEKVALLLGVLESLLLTVDSCLSLGGGNGMLDIEDLTINGLAVEVSDSLISALWAVVDVSILLVADEGKWSNLTVLLALFGDGNER